MLRILVLVTAGYAQTSGEHRGGPVALRNDESVSAPGSTREETPGDESCSAGIVPPGMPEFSERMAGSLDIENRKQKVWANVPVKRAPCTRLQPARVHAGRSTSWKWALLTRPGPPR